MDITLKILNDEGLHARPAGLFVKKANEFKSTITVKAVKSVETDKADGNNKTESAPKNGKSIMSLMGLGLKLGDFVTIEANGEDAELALKALSNLIENKFQL